MDGPGDYYAEWNKPVRERQIPYDFTDLWNLINKIKLMNKIETEHGYMEQTDSCQRGGEERGAGWKNVKGLSKKTEINTKTHTTVLC